jgi:hypothetical protein
MMVAQRLSRADLVRALGELGRRAHAEAAIRLVMEFYPRQRLEPKVQFGIEEIFAAPGKETT